MTNAALTNQLRDIRPPVIIPSGWAWIGWVLGAIASAALVYWGWRLWARRRAAALYVPPMPAHFRALEKLREALELLGEPAQFCVVVSDIARWYLEERFQFHAPERTTEEFLYELGATDLLRPDQKTSLGEFLGRCDLVKFAKYEPAERELRELHASAVRLVEETAPTAAALPAVNGMEGSTQITGTAAAPEAAAPGEEAPAPVSRTP